MKQIANYPTPRLSRKFLILACCAAWAGGMQARATVRMPAIFGDHMVLQQDIKIPVWGWADPGEKISVTFSEKTVTTITKTDGTWRVELPPSSTDKTSQTLRVTGKNRLEFRDVLVGDVWIASGQSNMEFGIQTELNGAQAIQSATDSQIRMFFVPWATSLEPKGEIGSPRPNSPMDGRWVVCSPESMAAQWAWHGFSAVGYYFAREIRQSMGHPVGMIGSYKGGTPAQSWTSLSGLANDPGLARHVAAHKKALEAYPKALAEAPQRQAEFKKALQEWNAGPGKLYNEALALWKKESEEAKAAGKPLPRPPQPDKSQPRPPTPPDGGHGVPSTLFNAMINPLIPYGIKGVIWYQGESNGDRLLDAWEYRLLFPRMIADWREKWGEGDFPFLFVQLASFRAPAQSPSEGNWAWVRDAQLKALALPNTAMASAVDIGNGKDIHPKDKLDVGMRLALAAKKVAYGKKLVSSGPTFEAAKVEGNKVVISFKNCGAGLVTGTSPWTPPGTPVPPKRAGSDLSGFGIAGEDQKFAWANAVIQGDNVVVSSPEIAKPVAVRYNWADNPSGNLYNRDGLPASPFRTDAWEPNLN